MVESESLSLDQLRQFDGKAGKPVYVAVNGKVYDVSRSGLWTDGDHQGMHTAGVDLTREISDAPHDVEALARFPVVGQLRE